MSENHIDSEIADAVRILKTASTLPYITTRTEFIETPSRKNLNPILITMRKKGFLRKLRKGLEVEKRYHRRIIKRRIKRYVITPAGRSLVNKFEE